MKRITLIFLLVTASLTACKEGTPGKTSTGVQQRQTSATTAIEQVHGKISRYNRLLSDGYKSTNMTSLQEVATLELAQKAYYHMAAISEGNARMLSQLNKLEFVETNCPTPQKCRVMTRERWDFTYADILTGKTINEVKDYVYDVQYVLEKRQGRWLITEVNASGEERKEAPSWKELLKKK